MDDKKHEGNVGVLFVAEGWFFYCGAWFIAYFTDSDVGPWIDFVRPYLFVSLLAVYGISTYLSANKERLKFQPELSSFPPLLAALLFAAVLPILLIAYFPISFVAFFLYLALLIGTAELSGFLENYAPTRVLDFFANRDILPGGVTALLALAAVFGIPALLERGGHPSVRALFGDPIFRGLATRLAECYGAICTGIAAVAVWNGERSWFSDVDEAAWRSSMRIKGAVGLLIGLGAGVVGTFGGRLESRALKLSRAGALQMAEGDLKGAEISLEAAYAACPSCLAAPARLAVLADRRGDEAAFKELSLKVGAGIVARQDAAEASNLTAFSDEDREAIAPLKELLSVHADADAREAQEPLAALPPNRRRPISLRCDSLSWELEALKRIGADQNRFSGGRGAYDSFCARREALEAQRTAEYPQARVFDDESSPLSGPILLSDAYARALRWFEAVGRGAEAPPAPEASSGVLGWFQETSRRGNPASSLALAQLYEAGQGGDKNPALAHRFYHAAAQQGSPQAMEAVGLQYERGDDTAPDLAQAYICFALACAHSHAARCDNAKRAGEKLHVKEWAAALKSLERLAAKGDAYAAYSLTLNRAAAQISSNWPASKGDRDGVYVQSLTGDAASLRLTRQAAESGVPAAERVLGQYYVAGDGGRKPDYAQGAPWLRKAAENYDCDGLISLGDVYDMGWGVSKDMLKAYTFYTVAQTHPQCQGGKKPLSWAFERLVGRETQAYLKSHAPPYDW